MYLALMDTRVRSGFKLLWHLKLSLKIKVSLWFVLKRATLNKDNLANVNGWETRAGRFALNRKPFKIYFLIVQWHVA